jgi:hypothetical protein
MAMGYVEEGVGVPYGGGGVWREKESEREKGRGHSCGAGTVWGKVARGVNESATKEPWEPISAGGSIGVLLSRGARRVLPAGWFV